MTVRAIATKGVKAHLKPGYYHETGTMLRGQSALLRTIKSTIDGSEKE